MSGFTDIVLDAWETPPDWVLVLAEACEATSQNQVAKQLRRSAAMISTVLRNKYTGDMAGVEERVRGVLMAKTIPCPSLGRIPAQTCQDWVAKSANFSNVNMLRVRMFKACNACPRNLKKQEEGD